MTNKDAERFGKLMMSLAEVFGGQVSKFKIKLYFEALKELSIDELEGACFKAIQELKWFPKPAEIRNLLLGDPETRAMLAWDTVLKALRTHGYYDSIRFADRLITACIKDMAGPEGWPGWSTSITRRNDDFIARDFQKRYRAYLLHPPRDAPEYLPGFHEINNRLAGYLEFIPKPVEIGEQAAKLMWKTKEE